MIYHISRLIIAIGLRLFTRRRVSGRDHIPPQGPLIVVANHLSAIDPPLVDSVLDRRPAFMAKEELFQSRLNSWFMRSLGAFPVSKGRPGRQALRQAMQALTAGRPLVIFPEGMRSRNGQLKHALPGAALIAERSGAPILPVGISGTEKIKGLSWLWHRPRVTVNIGAAFTLPPNSGKLTRDGLARHSQFIMARIAGLLPPAYRGHYDTGRQHGSTD